MGPGKASRKSKGKEAVEPQAPSSTRVPMLLSGTEAEEYFSAGGNRLIPPMPTVLSRALDDGARSGMALAIMLMQAGMGLNDLFFDLSGQEDNLKRAQARAQDFKGQLALSRAELEKVQGDLKVAQEGRAEATQRVAELEEKLKTAQENHQREVEVVRADARKEGVRDYVRGYRLRYRADFGKAFNSGLLFRVFVAQARRQGLENFHFDPKDYCGYDPHCPPYVPPPAGVFFYDGEDPLEA